MDKTTRTLSCVFCGYDKSTCAHASTPSKDNPPPPAQVEELKGLRETFTGEKFFGDSNHEETDDYKELKQFIQKAVEEAVTANDKRWKARVTNLLKPNESRRKCISTYSGSLSGGEMCPLCGFCPELAKNALLNPAE